MTQQDIIDREESNIDSIWLYLEGSFYKAYERSVASEVEARLLLQMAFAFEVLRNITDDDLRERMESLVEKRLRGEFAHCKNCS